MHIQPFSVLNLVAVPIYIYYCVFSLNWMIEESEFYSRKGQEFHPPPPHSVQSGPRRKDESFPRCYTVCQDLMFKRVITASVAIILSV
jgi:hypothetical protein